MRGGHLDVVGQDSNIVATQLHYSQVQQEYPTIFQSRFQLVAEFARIQFDQPTLLRWRATLNSGEFSYGFMLHG